MRERGRRVGKLQFVLSKYENWLEQNLLQLMVIKLRNQHPANQLVVSLSFSSTIHSHTNTGQQLLPQIYYTLELCSQPLVLRNVEVNHTFGDSLENLAKGYYDDDDVDLDGCLTGADLIVPQNQ